MCGCVRANERKKETFLQFSANLQPLCILAIKVSVLLKVDYYVQFVHNGISPDKEN